MNFLWIVLFLFLNACSTISTEKGVHWSYHGAKGPSHWGDLDPKFHACKKGAAQSPIDLKWKKPRDKKRIHFKYKPSEIGIVDNGHTIQVNFKAGGYVLLEGKKFDLLQMHFHSPSEHTISSRSYPMEVHFVHKNSAGDLAVLGAMIVEGQKNLPLEKIWTNFPQEKNKLVSQKGEKIDATGLMPKRVTHYHYLGSLTTPPCSEGVNWNVMNTPIEMSAEQVEKFRSRYPGTNRPLQDLHDRGLANF